MMGVLAGLLPATIGALSLVLCSVNPAVTDESGPAIATGDVGDMGEVGEPVPP